MSPPVASVARPDQISKQPFCVHYRKQEMNANSSCTEDPMYYPTAGPDKENLHTQKLRIQPNKDQKYKKHQEVSINLLGIGTIP